MVRRDDVCRIGRRFTPPANFAQTTHDERTSPSALLGKAERKVGVHKKSRPIISSNTDTPPPATEKAIELSAVKSAVKMRESPVDNGQSLLRAVADGDETPQQTTMLSADASARPSNLDHSLLLDGVDGDDDTDASYESQSVRLRRTPRAIRPRRRPSIYQSVPLC